MNSTVQYNNSSVLSATTAQLKTERALVLTITSIVSVLIILVVIVFGIRQYFKRKKIRRNYQNYLNDKETVNFLFESGSLLELDKKAVSKDEDLGYISESSSLLSSGSNNLVLKNDLLSFSLHKKGKRKKPNIPIRTSSLRDRTINGGHNLVKKERIVSEIAPRILKVKPLLASDKREKEDDVENRLDWNKVFTFLVNIIEPATWKLFFIELFDNGRHLLVCGKTSNTIIEHVELTHKGAMSGLFFDLFQEWIKLMGTEASPKQIEKALEGRGDNHALSKFKYFMRTPPLIHEHCKLAGSDHHMKENLQSPINNIERLDILGFREDATFRNRQIQCMALRNGSHTQGANNLFESYMFGQSLNFHSMREERYRFAADTEKRTRYEILLTYPSQLMMMKVMNLHIKLESIVWILIQCL
ncbi:uncharacterized protein LOC132738352 [Ruditapes philippinarum]|uniref:uncharacterized protein LOC132738352 n=1 Tax=Ruditapes philippinarum TaxID=129788 RepID=UPI00295B90E1|nr:uncharacterized protein LOC132738352 [Ruditapes philippinarum]